MSHFSGGCKAADIEKIQLSSTASVTVDNIKTPPTSPPQKMGAKHPEFCQKQEVRAINSQPGCTKQACYLNAGGSPVDFDDCLSSYSSRQSRRSPPRYIPTFISLHPLNPLFIICVPTCSRILLSPEIGDKLISISQLNPPNHFFFLATFCRRVLVGALAVQERCPSPACISERSLARLRSHLSQ